VYLGFVILTNKKVFVGEIKDSVYE